MIKVYDTNSAALAFVSFRPPQLSDPTGATHDASGLGMHRQIEDERISLIRSQEII